MSFPFKKREEKVENGVGDDIDSSSSLGYRISLLEEKVDKLLENIPESQDKKERLIHIEDKVDRVLNALPESILEDRYAKKSWSQHGEDILIWNKFEEMGIEHPSFIDIGANHPYDISNTAIFHVHGCTGINIDANPNNIELFFKYRPNDINICCGVGSTETTMPFYMFDEYSGLNTFIKENVDHIIAKRPDLFKEIKEIKMIEVKKLQTIIDDYNNGVMPDYMSIDIEGMEYEVLSGYDLKNNGPKILTLEVMKRNREMITPMEELMINSGYSLLLVAGSNRTYIRKELL